MDHFETRCKTQWTVSGTSDAAAAVFSAPGESYFNAYYTAIVCVYKYYKLYVDGWLQHRRSTRIISVCALLLCGYPYDWRLGSGEEIGRRTKRRRYTSRYIMLRAVEIQNTWSPRKQENNTSFKYDNNEHYNDMISTALCRTVWSWTFDKYRRLSNFCKNLKFQTYLIHGI